MANNKTWKKTYYYNKNRYHIWPTFGSILSNLGKRTLYQPRKNTQKMKLSSNGNTFILVTMNIVSNQLERKRIWIRKVFLVKISNLEGFIKSKKIHESRFKRVELIYSNRIYRFQTTHPAPPWFWSQSSSVFRYYIIPLLLTHAKL